MPVDTSALQDFQALVTMADAQRHRLPQHLRDACEAVSRETLFLLDDDGPGVAVALTPNAAALAAMLRVALSS